MEETRRYGLILLGLVLTLLITFTGIRWYFYPLTSSELWAHAVGTVLGVIASRYLIAVWDPVALQPRDPNTRSARDANLSCILPIIAVVSAFLSSISTYLLGANLRSFVGAMLFSASVIFLAFMFAQTWIHRPR